MTRLEAFIYVSFLLIALYLLIDLVT